MHGQLELKQQWCGGIQLLRGSFGSTAAGAVNVGLTTGLSKATSQIGRNQFRKMAAMFATEWLASRQAPTPNPKSPSPNP